MCLSACVTGHDFLRKYRYVFMFRFSLMDRAFRARKAQVDHLCTLQRFARCRGKRNDRRNVFISWMVYSVRDCARFDAESVRDLRFFITRVWTDGITKCVEKIGDIDHGTNKQVNVNNGLWWWCSRNSTRNRSIFFSNRIVLIRCNDCVHLGKCIMRNMRGLRQEQKKKKNKEGEKN